MTIQQIASQLAASLPAYTFKAINPSSIAVTDARKREVGVLSIGDPKSKVTPINLRREGPYDLLPEQAVTEITSRVRAILAAPPATK
ncbi:MAG TPA: hypothetical protein VMQ86_25550 [Bryobacteraceae bacterium]|jgi:hypothetical protein|nr:hypothetical protein [Bryobacteraceae bacterium]